MSNLIEVYIQRLRRKIDDGHAVKLIQTRRGAGYTLGAPPRRSPSMIETVRARLTLWYVSVLAAALLVVGGLIYVLLARALYARIDDNLQRRHADRDDVARQRPGRRAGHRRMRRRSTAAELSSRQQMLAIYDADGRLLAEEGRDDDLEIALPALDDDSRPTTCCC